MEADSTLNAEIRCASLYSSWLVQCCSENGGKGERPRDRDKDVRFNIRMAFENKERIERAAQVAKQSLTESAGAAVLERAKQILDRHERM
jgi:predicted HicB family RNase H-like nuclease